jgi:hypothetical protein
LPQKQFLLPDQSQNKLATKANGEFLAVLAFEGKSSFGIAECAAHSADSGDCRSLNPYCKSPSHHAVLGYGGGGGMVPPLPYLLLLPRAKYFPIVKSDAATLE